MSWPDRSPLVYGTPPPLTDDDLAPLAQPAAPSRTAEEILFRIAPEVGDGVKDVLRLEDFPLDEAEAHLAPFREEGFEVGLSAQIYSRTSHDPNWSQGRGGQREYTYGFVARTPRAIERALEFDTREKASGKDLPQTRRDLATMGLGVLLGYPQCCTDAFLTVDRRGDNRRWPVEIARRSKPGPWPWVMNNLQYAETLSFFFPCGYDCPVARETVAPIARHLQQEHPEYARHLQEVLQAVVLYFGWQELFVFPGATMADGWVRYDRVLHPGHLRPDLLGEVSLRECVTHFYPALAQGDRFRLAADALEIAAGETVLFRYTCGGEAFPAIFDFTGEIP